MRNKKIVAGVLTAMLTVVNSVAGFAASPVVGPGVGMPGSETIGPGVTGPEQMLPVEVSKGIDGFAGTVQNPIVTVTEKYSYDQMCLDIQSLSERYGGLMQTRVLGSSLDGREIYEIVVGNTDAPKHVLIHAGIHAREYMTPLLVMKQLEYALEFYHSGSYEGRLLSDLFNQVAIHFVPMANPDGICISQFGVEAIRSEELKQAVRQCYEDDVSLGRTSMTFDRYLNYWKANARGVDLNQNFPANWDQVKSAPINSYAAYKGASPLSEPESQILAELLNSRSWAATISYHSMGNIIYWNYAGNRVEEESSALAQLVSGKTGYRLVDSSGHGGFKDWAQIKDDPVPSLTLEVGGVSCPLPLTEFTEAWNRNREVWAAVAKYVSEN